jgi:enoyl-CoA hydratase/carnithine racemase
MSDLQVELIPPLAIVTINRPHLRNAINTAMWKLIPMLCERLEHEASVRVIIWQGAGDEAFSAGGDIHEFVEVRGNRQQAVRYNQTVDRALLAIAEQPKPTLAVIKGHCMGGGLMLAAHCDLRIAADTARFGIPVGKLGGAVTYAQLQRFLYVLGPAVTTELLLAGRIFHAEDALRVHLCNRVYPLQQVDALGFELGQQMAEMSPTSQHIHKHMLKTIQQYDSIERLDVEELTRVEQVFDSEDYAEGTRAFIEKRPARFLGK